MHHYAPNARTEAPAITGLPERIVEPVNQQVIAKYHKDD